MFLMTEMLPQTGDQRCEKPNLNLRRGKSVLASQEENPGIKRLVTIKNAKQES